MCPRGWLCKSCKHRRLVCYSASFLLSHLQGGGGGPGTSRFLERKYSLNPQVKFLKKIAIPALVLPELSWPYILLGQLKPSQHVHKTWVPVVCGHKVTPRGLHPQKTSQPVPRQHPPAAAATSRRARRNGKIGKRSETAPEKYPSPRDMRGQRRCRCAGSRSRA